MKIFIQHPLFTAMAAVDKDSTDDFLKAFTAIAMVYDFAYDEKFNKDLVKWQNGSTKFLRRFKLNKRRFDHVIERILRGYDPHEKPKFSDSIQKFVAEVKAAVKEFKHEMDIPDVQIKILNDLSTYGKIEAKEQTRANALKRLDKAVPSLRESALTELFTEEMEDLGDHSETNDKLRKLIKKMVGKEGTNLTAPEKKKYQEHKASKGTQHPHYEEFLRLRRDLTAVYKKTLQHLVRNKGKDTINVHDAISFMESKGVEHSIPEGFVGRIDEAGKLYTPGNKLLTGVPMGTISINPAYKDKTNDTYYVSVLTPAGNQQRIYTEEYRKGRTVKKFNTVSLLIPKLNKVKGAWRKDLKGKMDKRETILAALSELVYLTSGRVGSDSANTAGEKTFGITTLQPRHLSWKGQTLHIKYAGKKGGAQHHVVSPSSASSKRLLVIIKALAKDKEKTDRLWTHGRKMLKGSSITKYLKSKPGVPDAFTVHKLRTVRASILTKELLDKYDHSKQGLSATALNKWVIEQVKIVGKELGHFSGENVTAGTAIQHYIDPSIFAAFYKKLNIRPNAAIAKAIAKTGS